MSEQKMHKNLKLRLIQIAVCAAFGIVLFTMGAVWHGGRLANSEPVITSDLLSQQLTAVSELATVEYHYTNMGKFENTVDFYGWKVPFTRKSFIVSYDGVIKAGIDASQILVNLQGKEIQVTLPDTQILSHEILDDSIEIFDETKNIFNPIEISDYTGFSADQKDKMEQHVLENGLLLDAAGKARLAVENLFAPLGTDYIVSITN